MDKMDHPKSCYLKSSLLIHADSTDPFEFISPSIHIGYHSK